jgi:RNA polymerase sigma-70 factor (ECF subfamily)
MLGSSHDSDDVVQEALLRAWRSRSSLEDPARVRPWLYRIATNVCLDELQRRPQRALAFGLAPPSSDPGGPPAAPLEDGAWIEPMPTRWLDGVSDPAGSYTLKESVALAFVAALQILSPSQRAVLLLREVVGLTAEETAAVLEIGVSAANSALFRARAAIEKKLGGRDSSAFAAVAEPVDEALLARYLRALEASDIEGMIALLRDDVKVTMPPSPTWIRGRADVAIFFRRVLAQRFDRPDCVRALRTSANGQLALAFYRSDAAGQPHRLSAIQLLAFSGGQIAAIDQYMTPSIFAVFDVPRTLP